MLDLFYVTEVIAASELSWGLIIQFNPCWEKDECPVDAQWISSGTCFLHFCVLGNPDEKVVPPCFEKAIPQHITFWTQTLIISVFLTSTGKK